MNISDLKNDGNEDRVIDVKVSEFPKPEQPEPVSPSPDNGEREVKAVPFRPVKQTRQFGVGSAEGVPEARKSVNIDTDVPKPKEIPGVTIKESLEKEIFSEGGDFERYLQRKRAEAKQFMDQQVHEAELEGKIIVDGGVDLKPIIPKGDIEEVEIEDEAGDKVTVARPAQQQVQVSEFDPNVKLKMLADDILDD